MTIEQIKNQVDSLILTFHLLSNDHLYTTSYSSSIIPIISVDQYSLT